MHSSTGILPTPDDYPPRHRPYVLAVGDRDPAALLREQVATLQRVARSISDERALYRYAPGKWSIKEVIGHLGDTERILTYRLLRIVRGDATPLSGFEEEAYVAAAGFDDRPIVELVDDFSAIRASTLRLVRSISHAAWSLRGTASDHPVSAHALLYILPGHVEHHLTLLRGRYGVAGV